MSDDRELLTRLRQHDEAAFTEFFEAYADRVYRLAIGLLKQEDDAEEVVQATFVSAFEALDRFEPHARLSTWLYRIAYNHALMLIRRRHTVDPLPEEEEDATPFPVQLVDWSHLPDQHVLSGEAQQVLRTAVNELSMGLRAAFILRDMEGLSTAEWVQRLNMVDKSLSPLSTSFRLFLVSGSLERPPHLGVRLHAGTSAGTFTHLPAP